MVKTFDEFYYKQNGSKEYLDDLNGYVENNNNLLGKYQNQMYCPECKKAELSYVHRTKQRRAFLRRKPNEKHDILCSYQYDYASKKFASSYYTDLTDSQIQDRMASMMRKLLRETELTSETIVPKAAIFDDNPFVIENIEKEEKIHKTLRRKSICKYLDRNVDTELQLFYGKVRLNVFSKTKTDEQGKNYTIHFLNILCLNKEGKWTKRTSIYRCGILDNIDEDKLYNFVAVGYLEFKDNYTPNLKLANRRALWFQEIIE